MLILILHLTREAVKWFWRNYLTNQTNVRDPTVSPLQASVEQLKGLPPALIINAGFDVLREEGEAYADKLIQESQLQQLDTVFIMFNPITDTAAVREAIEQASDMLKKVLSV
jgi:acetyl esterase